MNALLIDPASNRHANLTRIMAEAAGNFQPEAMIERYLSIDRDLLGS